MVAVDLDGTLLRSDGTVSARTRAAVDRVYAAGARLVAVTARPARVIDLLADRIGLRGIAVCGNGTVEYAIGSGVVRVSDPLTAPLLNQVVDRLTAVFPGTVFAAETGERVLVGPGYDFSPSFDADRQPVGDLAEVITQPLSKLLVWLPAGVTEQVYTAAKAALTGLAECTWSGHGAPLEVHAPGVSKARALARLCRSWGLAAERVIAFGDAPSDLPMLRWAGTGVAMANAEPSVLRAVGHHTASNDDDGVAEVLERIYPASADTAGRQPSRKVPEPSSPVQNMVNG